MWGCCGSVWGVQRLVQLERQTAVDREQMRRELQSERTKSRTVSACCTRETPMLATASAR